MASGLAESAISYSAFPEPPSSIPATPIRSVFGSASPSLANVHNPVSFRRDSQLTGGSIASASNRFSRSTLDRETGRGLTSQPGKQESDVNSVSGSNISPYDWHEGASSIDVDATEDRLLPTSFITSLLRENTGPRAANRASYSSDAISGISEMTYPPRNPFLDSLRDSSAIPSHVSSPRQSHRGPLPRPMGGRPRNSHPRGNVHEAGSSEANSHGKLVTQENSRRDGKNVTRKGSMLSQSTLVAEQSDGSSKCGGKLAAYSEVEETEDESQLDIKTNSTSGFAGSRTNLASQRPAPVVDSDSRKRDSMHSTRSTAPSFLSRISSLGQRTFMWRRKPLPPLPTIPHVIVTAERGNQMADEQAPLPDLVIRANHLHGLLEKGYHPHQSVASYWTKNEQLTSSFDDATTTERLHRENSSRKQPLFPKSLVIAWVLGNKLWVILGIFILILIAIGSAVGVTAQRNKIHKVSTCQGDVGGQNCNLNATCVCTSPSSPSSCGSPIGQAILDIIPVMNRALSANVTTDDVYTSLWIAQGGLQSNCVEQVNMIDVGPGLDPAIQPNRTLWTQSALLWTLTQTQDPNSVSQLQKFIREAPWSHLSASDGPASTGPGFNVTVSGFSYDLASQTIIPISANFVTDGEPLSDQVSRVDTRLVTPLDRLYSYAVASSRQRDNTLLQYWKNKLHQREDSLAPFKAAFSTSPIILPFDATSQPIQKLYSATSFPPPTACYPGLNSDQLNLANTIEEEAFGLPRINTTSQFDTSCFPTHPVYGVLNVLRLRLPFPDSAVNVVHQGVILKPDVTPRAILAAGAGLSTLPGTINATRSLVVAADPRNYGTAAHANHIIFQYLSSMPPDTANAVIRHVLDAATSSTPLPPDNLPLDSIPSLEVAVFGNVEASDIGSYVSSFTNPSGSLFFGSDDGTAFRTWAIGRGGQIAWTANATSLGVVYDSSFSDRIFNLTWDATSAGINTNAPNVGLANITATFTSYQRFSP